MTIIRDLGLALFPAPEANEPPHTFRWRQTVAVCIISIGGLQVLQSALIWGFVPFFFSGFASAGQSEIQQAQLRDIRAGQIERAIQEAVEQRCYAQMQGNMPALDFANGALRKYQTDYYEVKKMYFREPACDALIVSKR